MTLKHPSGPRSEAYATKRLRVVRKCEKLIVPSIGAFEMPKLKPSKRRAGSKSVQAARKKDRKFISFTPNPPTNGRSANRPKRNARSYSKKGIARNGDRNGQSVFDLAAEAIRQSKERYRTLFDLVPVAVYVCDADGVILEYNQRAAELWGQEPGRNGAPSRFCGSHKIYHPDGRFMPHAKCPMARALRGEKIDPKDLHIIVERPDGERRHVIPAPKLLKDGRGKIIGAINCLYDNTEQQEADAAAFRLAAVVQSSHDAIAAKKLDGTVTSWNNSAERIFGYASNEIIGKSILTVIPPERWTEEKDILRKIRRGESLDHYETVRRRKDGTLIDVSLTISPIRDRGGKIIGISKIARDITKQKKTDRRASEQARLLELANDAIIIRDPKDRILYWNKGAEETYGYTRDEALGKVTNDLLKTEHPKQLPVIFKTLHRDHHWEGELVHCHRDGTRLTVLSRWSLDVDEKGKRRAVLETNTNITARKQTQEALAESEARMRAIVEQATAGMARVDRDTRIVFVNQRLCEMVGYTESELIGKPIRHFTHPADLKKTAELFGKLVNKGEPYETEKRYICKDGSSLWVNVSASPVRDKHGKTHSAVAVIVDITGRKQAEAKLLRNNEMLEELVQQRTQALRDSNYELENEINRRRGLEGQILEVSDREQQRLAQELHDGLCQELTAIGLIARATALRVKDHRVLVPEDIDKIATMINEAATNARTISRALHRVDVDAAGFVDAMQSLATREIWKTPCRIKVTKSFQIDDDEAAMNLYGIAREAVVNANKHARAREVVIDLTRSQEEIVLTVSDNGLGLKPDPEKSSGMGFPIMNYRAQSIGGRLEVESHKGAGTRISCHLPIRK